MKEELRIGNWVRTINEKVEYQIEEPNDLNDTGIEPIPLNEEWLVKLGIKKINNSMFRIGALTFQGSQTDDGGDLHNKIMTSRKSWRICYQGKFLCNKEHVHQLQNLFHALTGNELEIKES